MPAPSAVASSVSRPESDPSPGSSSAALAPTRRRRVRAVSPSVRRRNVSSAVSRPPAMVPSIPCNASSESPKWTTPRTSRAASLGVRARRAALTATSPASDGNARSNGSAGQGDDAFAPAPDPALASAPCAGMPIPIASAADRSSAPSSMSPSIVIGCCCNPRPSRPRTLAPATVPVISVSRSIPWLRASRAVIDAGSGSAARPAEPGRGERTFALVSLRLSSPLARARSGTRTVPFVATLSAPAASWPSTARSPSSAPFIAKVRRAGRLSTTRKRSRPRSSISVEPSSASNRAPRFTLAAARPASFSSVRASRAAPASPCSATRNVPARASSLIFAVTAPLSAVAGSSPSAARKVSGVKRPAERRS